MVDAEHADETAQEEQAGGETEERSGPGRPAGDLLEQVASINRDSGLTYQDAKKTSARGARQEARRAEALSLRLAGLTYEQIGERLGISVAGAHGLVERTLGNAINRNVEAERAVENARLDRVQAAIWTQALQGDTKAINTFLSISKHRAQINGLYAPMKVDMSVSIRKEMTEALDQLENLVLGTSEVISEEVIQDESGERGRSTGSDGGAVAGAGDSPPYARRYRDVAG